MLTPAGDRFEFPIISLSRQVSTCGAANLPCMRQPLRGCLGSQAAEWLSHGAWAVHCRLRMWVSAGTGRLGFRSRSINRLLQARAGRLLCGRLSPCSLCLQDYLKTVKGFKIEEAFPDIKSNPYHWRVDPYEPNRVWYTVRTTATHTGPLRFGMTTYKATSACFAGQRWGDATASLMVLVFKCGCHTSSDLSTQHDADLPDSTFAWSSCGCI